MELIWFISGVLFALVVIPILDSLTNLIMTMLEAIKTKYAESIHNRSIRMQKAASSLEEHPTRQIGFVLSEEEEEVDDEND